MSKRSKKDSGVSMGESHDFITLDWVQTDIEATLLQAQESLEAYLADVEDKGPLSDCYDAVHQVHGSLQMVGVSGAMLLTEEMELLINALREDNVEQADAHAALVQALVVLQPYLERVKNNADEAPMLLLPTINEIRKVLGSELLSEFSLFEPEIPKPPLASDEIKTNFDEEAVANIRKLRQIYQFALIGLIRNEDVKINKARMSNVFARFQQLCKNSPINQLWEIAAAFQEGILNETIELDSLALNALRNTDKEIKKLIFSGVAGLDNSPNQEILKNMLYSVAKSAATTPHIQAIKQEYNLQSHALSSADSANSALVAGPDKDTLNSVVTALREELERIKDTIDLYVRNDGKGNIDLGGLQPSLQQVANTLVILNLEAPKLVVQEQLDTLLSHSNDNKEVPDDVLLQIAEALLYVEAELESVVESVNSTQDSGASGVTGSATETVLAESLENLRQGKEALSEFFASSSDLLQLEDVPSTLRSVYGGLTMLSYTTAAQLILAVTQYVEDDILAMEKEPEQGPIEAIAEVISGVEYYLEGIVSGKPVGEAVLEQAKQHVASLGYPIEQAQGISSEELDQSADSIEFTCDNLTLESDDNAAIEYDFSTSSDSESDALENDDVAQHTEELELQNDESSEDETAEIISFELPEGETEALTLEESSDSINEVAEPVDNEQAGDASEDNSLVDDEILEIFVEEAEEVFEAIDNQWPLYVNEPGNQDALTDVRRAFHTLKGSGRMVGADVLGELSWSIENMLNHILENSISMNGSIITLIDDVRDVLPSLLTHFNHQTESDIDVAALISRADRLTKGEEIDEPEVVEAIEETTGDEGSVDSSANDFIDNEVVAEFDFEAEDKDSANDLEQIFIKEAADHLAVIDTFVGQVTQSVEPMLLSSPLYRALHTLSGGAQMASLDAVAEIASASEHLVSELRAYEIQADQELLTHISEASRLMKLGLEQLDEGVEVEIEGANDFLDHTRRLSSERIASAQETVVGEGEVSLETSPLQAFIVTNIDRICSVNEQHILWSEQGTEDLSLLAQICTNIEELLNAAQDVAMPAFTDLLTELKRVYLCVQEQPEIAGSCLDALNNGHEGLISMMDECAAGLDVTPKADAVAALVSLMDNISVAEEDVVAEEVANIDPVLDVPAVPQVAEIEVDAELMAIFLEESEEIVEATANAKERWMENIDDKDAVDELQRGLHTLKGSSRMAGIAPVGDLSHELESIYEDINADQISASSDLFDLLHACDDCLADMLSNLKQGLSVVRPNELIADVQRFHAEQLGNEMPAEDMASAKEDIKVFDTALGATIEADVDALEGFLVSAQAAQEKLSQAVLQSAQEGNDKTAIYEQIQTTVAELKDSAYQAGVHELGDLCQFFVEVVANIDANELGTEEVQTDLTDWLERIQISYQEIKASVKAEKEPEQSVANVEVDVAPENAGQASSAPTQNNIRVSSTLLEQLVNLAGETSVSRARIEQQVSNFGYALDEVGSTVERLREQLRRLELETEAQILFRAERDGPAHEGFDPLEMDRYSRIQELSRALVESVSDMFDLKDTLRDRLRYTDSLLLQQSRVNTELQEGLMKTRMVPFSRMVPRLQRIVRQVSRELGKDVEFTLKNADAEMDRSLLQHMTAPLEHMLRNAVDHGIETAEKRKQAGKADKGSIELRLSRDGGDIVLELKDDGAGIDIESVRAKAIERDLMADDADLSDHEILQFILQAGFSTADKVTQISGRGVGMDVVHSEIKKMGGSIKIDSELGSGSRFAVRVPFTVSVNRALLVTIGEEIFALPLSTIEGVVRVSPYELEEYYKEDGPDFEYAGETYDLHYLGDYVGHKQEFTLQNQALPLPVILIRSGDQTAAIQVDSITASREIVVKPLGVQLGSLPGMSGATILGDGQVVLILDLAALIRAQAVVQALSEDLAPTSAEPEVSDQLRVMVVDDSVTVRKVASRLLERHGMQVVVAKDGVEAMTKLQDFVPSIMLLDIEMPRMDGFELASLVRHDERLSEVPIVMISSRTGQKHQDRAKDIGVNSFMGKPFQEEELLSAITEFTAFERSQAEE